MRVLITGSEGLIGTGLRAALAARGHDAVRFDLKLGDTTMDLDALVARMQGCDGVVHLAAVSRVMDAEFNNRLAWDYNVEGTRNVLDATVYISTPPWVVFASSREVYGHPDDLPVDERAPPKPCNFYGYTKVTGETMMREHTSAGLGGCVVRFANVYGSVHDHATRVVPAFCRQAVMGEALCVEGSAHLFDFTYIDDVAWGVALLCERMMVTGSGSPDPIHFVSGEGTTLGELATLAIEAAGTDALRIESPPRSYDVARFVGDPSRAERLLGWTHKTGVAEGVRKLVEAFEAVV